MPDFIVAPQRPLDGLLLDILRRVDGVARAQKVGYFLGGAMARDVILQHVFGVDTRERHVMLIWVFLLMIGTSLLRSRLACCKTGIFWRRQRSCIG